MFKSGDKAWYTHPNLHTEHLVTIIDAAKAKVVRSAESMFISQIDDPRNPWILFESEEDIKKWPRLAYIVQIESLKRIRPKRNLPDWF